MTQTAQTIGSKEGTYQERLLSFVNTEELISRMDEVVEELKNEYELLLRLVPVLNTFLRKRD